MNNNELAIELEAAKNRLLEVKESVQQMKCQYDRMADNLHDCVNELCLKCGAYHESYLGACDGCRWKAVKEEFQ